MRTKKLRERIDNAVTEAQQAAHIAIQKTGIATARYARRAGRFTKPVVCQFPALDIYFGM